jgi:hypothetical protein
VHSEQKECHVCDWLKRLSENVLQQQHAPFMEEAMSAATAHNGKKKCQRDLTD